MASTSTNRTVPLKDGPQEGIVDFHHPYTPYDVQVQFMKAVYGVLEAGNGQIGILESPTGTGKSLSLICASLTWLRNFKASSHEAMLKALGEKFADEPEWVVEQLLKRKREELTRRWEEREERLAKIREKEQAQEARRAKRRRVEEGGSEARRAPVDEDAEWLLDDWEDRDAQGSDPLSGLSSETREILARMGLGGPKKKEEEDDTVDDEIKIFYASRTHSQLSQFVSELRRPTFPSSYPSLDSKAEPRSPRGKEHVKHVPLSSRQKLCINPSVSRLGSLSAINDRCAELQQSKTKEKCRYIPGEETLSQTHQFRDTALATVPDIEDLHALGKSLSVCPYYASRTAIPASEIITLPYPLLLQKSARDALGIKLEGNVVIIDEAHNIMDAVSSVNAAAIKLSELKRARQMLGVYVRKFGKRLKGENRVMVGRVGRVIQGLSEWLEVAMQGKSDQGIADSDALLRHKSIDQINMFKLVQYIQESKLAYKIESYVTHIEQDPSSQAAPRSSTPVLHTLLSFLLALTNLSFEGRIFYQKDSSSSSPDIQLSYLLLSPTHAFSSIASSARAVILAGGTMSPFDDYTAHLFPSLPLERVTTLSCGHVIPASNLSVRTLAKFRNPSGGGESPFEFSFSRRGDKAMITQLGLALVNICSVVPDGVVAFFPSYGYLDEVVRAWQSGPVWDRLASKKALFRESRGDSGDETLASYSAAILSPDPSKASGGGGGGALLLSVVGGKMSEGINFSDRLGRCVLIVGLPYPNINSPEWKAKTEYVESTTISRLLPGQDDDRSTPTTGQSTPGGPVAARGMTREKAREEAKLASRSFYENACMRAVNQSIGRAIRHQGDYAAIILVDRRYASERIRGKLPRWIAESMEEGEDGLGKVMGGLSSFFRGKNT